MAETNAPSFPAGTRLVFVVNHVAFFVSHRLPIARAAQAHGFTVKLITGKAGSSTMEGDAENQLRKAGIEHTRTAFSSSGVNPFMELLGLLQLISCVKKLRPDIVHCASPKGGMYGGMAARFAKSKGLVIAVSGMGFAATPTSRQSTLRVLAGLATRLLARIAYGHPNKRVIVQNGDDQQAVVRHGLAVPHEIRLIPGSGVDLDAFVKFPIEAKRPMVLFPARMLADKGLLELVEAFRAIKSEEPDWQLVLAGAADYKNPSSVSPEQIQAWEATGLLQWIGHVIDMAPLYAQASIVCLPSYREGLPKALLEAAAAGCAVVTTDATGCRDAIIPGITGELVPVANSRALADTLLLLIRDRERRERYGRSGRNLAIERYDINAVIGETLSIYAELLANGEESNGTARSR